MSTRRIDAFRQLIRSENLDGFIVTDLNQMRYLCGYTGSNGLFFVTLKEAHFLTDFRYTEQARKQVKSARVKVCKSGALVAALSEMEKLNSRNHRIGYDPGSFTVAGLDTFRKSVPDVLPVPSPGLISELGWVKEPDEVKSIREACRIADIAFERILNIVRPGVRESELAAELEYQMIMLGSEKAAFESIVASGPRGALPHGIASRRKIRKGELITFDFGATFNGYVSDITRTVLLGKATSKQKLIYNIVLRAQKAGVRKIKPGLKASKVDKVCRDIISKAGYGKEFGHGTGHGIGFVVHTGPGLSAISQDILKPNNIVTVEPGIYIAGWGGVRIEDDVLVTRNGHEVLTKAEKKLLEL